MTPETVGPLSRLIDVTKVFATLEELVGLDMQWGKLARKGRI